MGEFFVFNRRDNWKEDELLGLALQLLRYAAVGLVGLGSQTRTEGEALTGGYGDREARARAR